MTFIQGLEIAGGIIAIYFIVAMMFLFSYIYFKKGSWKKSLLHIFISILLLVIVVMTYMLQGQSANSTFNASDYAVNGAETAGGSVITDEIKEILTHSPEDVSARDLLVITRLASSPLIEEEAALYREKIKEFYIYQGLKVHLGTEAELLQKFEELQAEAGQN